MISLNWIVARLREPSSWRGLIWLLTACGVTLRPEIWEQITAVGMAAAGLLGVLSREEPTRVEIQLPSIDLVGQAGAVDRTVPGPVADRGSAADRLRRPVRAGHNPDEAADTDNDHPGWGS